MFFAYLPSREHDRGEIAREFLQLAERGKVLRHVAPGHHDGWGVAAYSRGELIQHYRSEESGITDGGREQQLRMLRERNPEAMLLHVRKASVGEPSEKNSHPFISGRFTFIHNGTLGNPDQEIFREVTDRVDGDTDTERYFHLIIRDLEEHDTHEPERVISAIKKTVQAIRVGTSFMGAGFSSASSILSDGRYAYILREFDENHPAVASDGGQDYYTLFFGLGASGERFVCSETLPLAGVEWELIPNHTLTIVDFDTGGRSVVSTL
jgi:glutamine amidotransferase